MEPDELPRVTVGMLRRAETMCPRRLAHEHFSGRRLTKLADGAFQVENRLVEDARTAHRDPDVPLAHAFADPTDLEPEQRAVYRAAAAAYVARYAGTTDEADDLGLVGIDGSLGVRLAGSVGIPLVATDGTRCVRIVRIAASDPIVDACEVAFVLVRAGEWAGARLVIEAWHPIEDRIELHDLDVGEKLPQAREWIARRIEVIRSRAESQRAVVGSDCARCACIPGCPPLLAHS